MKKYIVYPGWVRSRTDGDRQYIGFSQLCHLYGVPHYQCISGHFKKNLLGLDLTKFEHLRPRHDGNYHLRQPKQKQTRLTKAVDRPA